ncbi:hypothetical protein [Streptomyces xantholiticus]|uniref:Uncharacterized protein n=1 Tax=Streptomyces xantholiticus TaxID=68285 RepID=A0ABV1UWU9_9ACTN
MNHRRARVCVSVLATVLIGASITTAGAATPADDASAAERLGDITGFEANGDEYTVSSGQAKLRISFQDDDLFRVHLAPDGRFTDPANDDPSDPKAPDADIVVKRAVSVASSVRMT